MTIDQVLQSLGHLQGWAANEIDGIVVWENDDPQPTETELIAAGWIKPQEETPTE